MERDGSRRVRGLRRPRLSVTQREASVLPVSINYFTSSTAGNAQAGVDYAGKTGMPSFKSRRDQPDLVAHHQEQPAGHRAPLVQGVPLGGAKQPALGSRSQGGVLILDRRFPR